MLDVTQVEDYLAEVRAFADKHKLREQLEGKLNYLDTYAEHEGDRGATRCHLFTDFAPHSFSILMEKRQEDGSYDRWWNGGLIYHAPGGGNGGMPELSVNLNPTVGWMVHT